MLLTPKDVLTYPQFQAKKVAPTKIRPFTLDDVLNKDGEFQQDAEGTFFLDQEKRRQPVVLGRCLLIGVSPEDRWTSSSTRVEKERISIGFVDEEGFQLYVMRNPALLTCFDIPHAFMLDNGDGKQVWECQEPCGGYVTWNGVDGPGSIMRVVQHAIFDLTYQQG